VKKFFLLLLVVLGLAVYMDSSRYGLSVGGAVLALDGDRFEIDRRTRRFLEDLKYKDFDHAATFHTPEEREEFDIAAMIEKKFYVKPEHLDIRHFEILRVDVSDSGDRGKAVIKATVKLLNLGKIKDAEAVFYWKKVEGTWYQELRSSL